MDTEFTIGEVFALAEEVEARAAGFYQQLAQFIGKIPSGEALLTLAKMEDDHRLVFMGLREAIGAEEGMDRHQKARWRSIAHILIDSLQDDLKSHFAGPLNVQEVLRHALKFEKDSVVFYLAMRDELRTEKDRTKVDLIIKEELGHIMLITSRLLMLGTPPAPGADNKWAGLV